MTSPSDMVLFAAVVDDGGFSAAARRLGLSKQTISERVRKLEEQLGVRLLERTTRRIRLTEPGSTYYEHCAAIAAHVEAAHREVQDSQAEPAGTLRLSTPTLYGRRYLAPLIAAFMTRYPRTRIEITLADRHVNLVEEGFDLAIRVGKLADSSMSARKLGEGYVHYVASPAFIERHGVPKPAALGEARCLAIRHHETWRVRETSVKIDPVLVVNDLEVCCDAAIAGVGIARLPSILCREPVARGRLQVLYGPAPAEVRPVYAVFPSRLRMSTIVRAFVDSVVDSFEPMLPLG